ncbi:uncharacterized protein LOC120005346 [Tripterygium wilfordii]|uniref:uncharacterized protein LOC120005346 n=1 Tax=Tripterygium wilfordii TaxID=458696 RepID=UPI0018F856A3|nr:uncharacterized protein LOC120005346 [Tripterygium wilfordii]
MAEISMEQKSVVEGQKQVWKKYEQIQREREQLWKEKSYFHSRVMLLKCAQSNERACRSRDNAQYLEGAIARTVHQKQHRSCKSTRQSRYQKGNIKAAIMRVREEMAEISETQSSI